MPLHRPDLSSHFDGFCLLSTYTQIDTCSGNNNIAPHFFPHFLLFQPPQPLQLYHQPRGMENCAWRTECDRMECCCTLTECFLRAVPRKTTSPGKGVFLREMQSSIPFRYMHSSAPYQMSEKVDTFSCYTMLPNTCVFDVAAEPCFSLSFFTLSFNRIGNRRAME